MNFVQLRRNGHFLLYLMGAISPACSQLCGREESCAEAADPLPGALVHVGIGFAMIWTQTQESPHSP